VQIEGDHLKAKLHKAEGMRLESQKRHKFARRVWKRKAHSNLELQDLVIGTHDFKGKRLNILQIGLGTFGTFLENLTDENAASYSLHGLLEATRNSSKELLGVGVEPVSKHVDRLRPCIEQLPNTALVRAAVGKENQSVNVYALDQECHMKALSELNPLRRKECEERIVYLQNMSCVGEAHPEFESKRLEIEAVFGVRVELRSEKATLCSYDALSHLLGFCGADVLMIDAEGHDCQILQSMIDHCQAEGNGAAWPDMIQFETMGHNDCKDGCGAEENMLKRLEEHGYVVACLGNDAQLVHTAALQAEPHLQQWLESLACGKCGNVGHSGAPFRCTWESGSSWFLCDYCHSLYLLFGFAVWNWTLLPCDEMLWSLATDGTSAWGVDGNGDACCHKGHCWQTFGGSLHHLSVSCNGQELWGVDSDGQLVHRSLATGDPWTAVTSGIILKRISAVGDGTAIWCIDKKGDVCVWLSTEKKLITLKGEKLEHISVSADGAYIWGVGTSGEVYFRGGLHGSWERVPGSLCQIAVSGDGWHVWGVNCHGTVYYKSGRYGEWLEVRLGGSGQLEHVCVSDDGWQVWGVDRRGYLWTFAA